MRRAYRLFAPGIAFAVLGLAAFIAAASSENGWLRLQGRVPLLGAYALACQIALAWFLAALVDDFGDHVVGRAAMLAGIPEDPFGGYRRRLATFYRRSLSAALLLGFGVGSSLGLLVLGIRSESICGSVAAFHPRVAILAAVLVVSAGVLRLTHARLPALIGWCYGFGGAVALAEGPSVCSFRDVVGMLLLLPTALVLAWLVASGVTWVLRRGRGKTGVLPTG